MLGSPSLIRSPAPLHLAVGLVLVAAAVGLAAWSVDRLRDGRADLWRWAAVQRQQQLERAVADVESELQGVSDDLEFAARSRAAAASPEEAGRILETLLALARPYRAVVLFNPACERELIVSDPRWQQSTTTEQGKRLEEMGLRACRAPESAVFTSPPEAANNDRWLRAFTRSSEGGGSVAILVDTEPILARLATVAADQQAELLVLGPHRLPTPSSSSMLTAALSKPNSALSKALSVASTEGTGWAVIDAAHAGELGLPGAAALLIYCRIDAGDAAPWSAVVVASTSALAQHEASLRSGLYATAGGALTLVLLLAGYVVVTARRDATQAERLRASEGLARLRERAERIVQGVPAGMVSLGATGTPTSINRAFEKQFPGARVGEGLAQLFPGAAAAEVERLGALVAETMRSGQTLQLPTGSFALGVPDSYFALALVPIDPDSPDAAVLLTVEDQSRIRQLQEQVLRAEKLSTVGVLAAGLAHEIGTPLGVVRGRAEFALHKLGGDHPQAPSLSIIIEQIDRISRLIRSVLDFSSRRGVAPHAARLDAILARSRDLVTLAADKQKVRLQMDVEPGLPAVAGDEDQLLQVVVNLLMNAVDASNEGAVVRFDARSVVISPTATVVRLRVIDEGSGIPAEDLARVFDPFFTTKKRGQGTGLGLAVVAQIVRDHGGEVRVHSAPGRGTTFEVDLLIGSPHAQPA